MSRLFLGCPVAATDPLRRLTRQLAELPGRSRVEPEANWHVTVKFLGAVAVPRVAGLVEVARDIAGGLTGGYVELSGVGLFPSRRRPGVLWAGCSPGSVLEELAARLEAACQTLGFLPEARLYHPHVTLLRIRPPVAPGLFTLCDRWAAEPLGRLWIHELWLYESQPDTPGAGYRVRERFCLSNADGAGAS